MGNNRVSRWWPGQARCEVLIGFGSLPQLQSPQDLCFDEKGRLLVSEAAANRVTSWTLGHHRGEIIAGGRGRGNGLDQLNGPVGMLFVQKARPLDIIEIDLFIFSPIILNLLLYYEH